MWKLLLVM
jgi:hypothetical protein